MFASAVRLLPKLPQSSIRNITYNVSKPNSIVPRTAHIQCAKFSMGMNTEMEISRGQKLNDFEKAKVKRKFALYDVNGDGSIKHDDYEIYIGKIKEAYGLDEDSELLYAFKNEFEAHWQRMLRFMDENKDGILSLDEWMDFYPLVTRTSREKKYDNLPKFLQTLADAFFTLMDSKHDGLIDAEEYKDFWSIWDGKKIPIEEAKEHVKFMTTDGKHVLNLANFREIHADYTWSNNPKTPGRYAYGPIEFKTEGTKG